MKIGFCFAGQGAQIVGMGKDFYDSFELVREIYDEFPKIRDLCFFDNDLKINETRYCQKAILLTSYAIGTLLISNNIIPTFCCGLSLGEYTALTISDVWNLKDAIEIVTKRGEIMQDALPLNTSKMAAVIGLDRDIIKSVINDIDGIVEIANYNCPGQIVITGENDAIDAASKKLIEKKARRVIPLNVSGAFHSSLLTDASKELRKVLDKYIPRNPKYRMVYNISGKEESNNINQILQEQICHSVYFEDSINYMIDSGVDTFIEIGPGKTLASFIRKTNSEVKIINVSSVDSFNKLLNEIINYGNNKI